MKGKLNELFNFSVYKGNEMRSSESIYIYICIHIFICMCVCMWLYIYIYIYTCRYPNFQIPQWKVESNHSNLITALKFELQIVWEENEIE